ncbi:hypothetical protein HGRIS_003597 [Hohenbuehelia grisea]|uniref:BZIP domain-containing protein n=1 Tax=Hohenbuehelia grisea TaxID=104357 RepID=A0ABR3JGU9_9AGAR
MSSSKRGRKRNDNLPPNRARDVQRAFRARRAAHLASLEQRVSELEEENNCLRQALNLPPANRAPLGKGPTGKDKPKLLDSSPTTLHTLSSRDSSSADAESPTSTRTSSLSPSAITASMSPRGLPLIENTWDQPLLMSDQHPDTTMGSPSTSYPLTPMSAPLPTKPFHYSSYPSNDMSASARHTLSTGPLYNMTPQTPYAQPEERPSNGYNGPYLMRATDARDGSRQTDYTAYQSYQSHDPSMQSPPATAPLPSQSHPLHPQSHPAQQRDSYSATALPYPHRRSMTEPQFTIGSGFPHLPHPMQATRVPSPPHIQEPAHPQNPYPRTATYTSDGRLNTIA